MRGGQLLAVSPHWANALLSGRLGPRAKQKVWVVTVRVAEATNMPWPC